MASRHATLWISYRSQPLDEGAGVRHELLHGHVRVVEECVCRVRRAAVRTWGGEGRDREAPGGVSGREGVLGGGAEGLGTGHVKAAGGLGPQNADHVVDHKTEGVNEGE